MGLLIVIGAIVVIVGGPLVWFLAQSRLRPGALKIALVGVAIGEAEKNLWVGALGSAGIRVRVRTARWPGPLLGAAPTMYNYEVWVPARDEERARKVLGL